MTVPDWDAKRRADRFAVLCAVSKNRTISRHELMATTGLGVNRVQSCLQWLREERFIDYPDGKARAIRVLIAATQQQVTR